MKGLFEGITEQGNLLQDNFQKLKEEEERQETLKDKILLRKEDSTQIREELYLSMEKEKKIIDELIDYLDTIDRARAIALTQLEGKLMCLYDPEIPRAKTRKPPTNEEVIQDLENLETEEEEEEEEKEIYPAEDPEKVRGRIYENL